MAGGWRRIAAVAALLGAGPCCLAQSLTVRVVNAANRHPLPGQPVKVALFYTRDYPPAHFDEDMSATTDARGEALFQLAQPAPEQIFVQAVLPHGKWQCVCNALVVTQEITSAGIVEAADAGHPAPAGIVARPGEIVLTARPRPFWKRLFDPLYRD
jgi:hypothetical protein